MKEYAAKLYKSEAWKQCRKSYIKSVGGLCEDCLKKGIYTPAFMVHHIEHITPDNIDNPEIALNYANLRAVCRDCHAKYHSNPRPYTVDEYGRVTIKEPTYESISNCSGIQCRAIP